MCFSATASFIVGLALIGFGIVTLRMAKKRNQIPLASIPALFGIQQISEGFIWLSVGSQSSLNQVSTLIYSFFSHVYWPIYVPFAILLLEKVEWRKKALLGFQALGLTVGLIYLFFMIKYPIASSVINKSINYSSNYPLIFWLPFAYIAASCISCFFSSHKLINIFGALGLISAGLTYWLFTKTFVSVWCFAAAILSFIIFLHFYQGRIILKGKN